MAQPSTDKPKKKKKGKKTKKKKAAAIKQITNVLDGSDLSEDDQAVEKRKHKNGKNLDMTQSLNNTTDNLNLHSTT